MLSYPEALSVLRRVGKTKTLSVIHVPLESACGFVLAEDIVSSENFPVFSNSAMDGFLVQAPMQPGNLQYAKIVAAGDPEAQMESGRAVEIMTGAPLRFTGNEAVVRQEDTRRLGDTVEVNVQVKIGDNIRLAGSDVEAGQKVLSKGTQIASQHVMMLAALGIEKLPVFRKFKVALIATGNELANGQIRNSNGPHLITRFEEFGLEVVNLGICPDKPEQFDALLNEALDVQVDMIVSTGAVSVGAFDFVERVLQNRSAKIHFHKVAIRPGKPILFAELEGTTVLAMPGNPMAAAVGFRFFMRPYLEVVRGEREELPWTAKLEHSVKTPEGLTAFFVGKLQSVHGSLEIDVFDKQASYCVSGLANANAWALLPPDRGEIIEVYPI